VRILHVHSTRPEIWGRFAAEARAAGEAAGVHVRALRFEARMLSFERLDEAYRRREPALLEYYGRLERACEEGRIDVLLVNSNLPHHPDFIAGLRRRGIYAVYWTGDDPEGSRDWTVPYVRAYDMVLCWGVFYDENTRVRDKLLEWGARRAEHVPFGLLDFKYEKDLKEEDLAASKRPIDLVYVGVPAMKLDRLLRLRRHFGRRLELYGKDWGGFRGAARRLLDHGMLLCPRKLSDAETLRTYRSAKIGFNMHQTYGPSNLRTFELPANGVLQICDNPKGLSELFELDKEVVAFETLEEAVAKAEHYLAHDDERREIAWRGFRRAVSCWRHSDMLGRIVRLIREDRESGWKERAA
jgi:spore maturation protein CgeB